MNKVFLKGRLARDVDLRTTTTGKSVAQVSIAVNRWGKDQGADLYHWLSGDSRQKPLPAIYLRVVRCW